MLLSLLMAGISALLSGCVSDNPHPEGDDPELVFRHLQHPGENLSATDGFAIVSLRRLDFPGDADLSRMRAMLETTGLSSDEIAVWQEHGLHAGTLTTGRVQEMFLQLPPWIDGRQSREIAGDAPVPVVPSLPLGKHNITLPLPRTQTNGDAAVQQVTLEGGRVQFLLKVRRVEAGKFLLELVPHHNRPAMSIEPRLRSQRALEGSSYPSLRLLSAMSDDRVLVVMLHEPMPSPSQPEAAQAADANPLEATEQTTSVQKLQPSPRHWGDLLLGRWHQHKPVQIVLMISVQDFSPSPPRQNHSLLFRHGRTVDRD